MATLAPLRTMKEAGADGDKYRRVRPTEALAS